MDFFQLLDDSNLSTKIIVYSFWFLVGYFFSRVYIHKSFLNQLLYLSCFTGIAYFIIDFFSSIPFSIYVSVYLLPSFIMSLCFFYLGVQKKQNKGNKPLVATVKRKNNKPIIIDTQKGVSVQGAAGSGKTVSIAGWLLKHYGANNVGGILYDYKDFELVEMASFFYKDSLVPILPFSPFAPQMSIQFNPISPDILKREEDVKLMSKCIVANVIQTNNNNSGKFFNEVAEGAITGVIYTLKEVHPDYCSFSYLVAIMVTKDIDGLCQFIEKSNNATIHARSFLDSAGGKDQMAGVKATLSNCFSQFANPNIFYCMERNSIDFSLNESHNKALFCAINKPSLDEIYSPVLSVVIQSLIMKMSERNREESFILLDEAPTIKINRIGRVPATMRSFKVATIYMLQDVVQATIQMGKDKMREIFANLSTICFGKTNDPETAKFCESYFDEVVIKQKSVSYKSGSLSIGDKRTSVSQRKEKAHKSYEMFKRSVGEFFVFDDKGDRFDAKIKAPFFKNRPLQPINKISQMELNANYQKVLNTAKAL